MLDKMSQILCFVCVSSVFGLALVDFFLFVLFFFNYWKRDLRRDF